MSEIQIFQNGNGIFVRNQLTSYTHSRNPPMAWILQLCNCDNGITRIIKIIDTERRASGKPISPNRLHSDVMKAPAEMRNNRLTYYRTNR